MNIFEYITDSAHHNPENVALVINNTPYTYLQLKDKALQITYLLTPLKPKFVGVFGARSLTTYIGVLGSLAAGKTYVPLSLKVPAHRNAQIIDQTELDVLILDKIALQYIQQQAMEISKDTILLIPEEHRDHIPPYFLNTYKVYTKEDLHHSSEKPQDICEDTRAYLLFTSGTTGVPKGVPISHKNLSHFLEYLKGLYDFKSSDRFSQSYDINFDPSLQNMFLAWNVGATLYVIPEDSLVAPARFIKENELTVWDSVPSMIHIMNRFRLLKDNAFPKIRYSFFGGEPLPLKSLLAWQKAAPNSINENHYGPTEATIGISRYRIPDAPASILQYHGIIAIGNIFKTHEFRIIDDNGKINKEGELYLSGPQVCQGYWNNTEMTKRQFTQPDGNGKIWYKTGDLVRYENGNLFFIGRKDSRVKIRGYLVELEEINFHLKKALGDVRVQTIVQQGTGDLTKEIYSFIEGSQNKSASHDILLQLKKKLPMHMVPKKLIFVNEIPLNENGKTDILKLRELLN